MTGERTARLRRAQMRKTLRSAERAGRAVARRNARLSVSANGIAEQVPSIAAAAVAAAAAETVRPRGHRFSGAQAPSLKVVFAGIVLVAAVASTLSTADTAQSAAWFTASQQAAGNTLSGASVKVGGVGPDLDPTSALAVSNILPMTTEAATTENKAAGIDLVVRNTGTVPIDWYLSILDVATTVGEVDMSAITNVSYRIGTGAWSAPVKLKDLASIEGKNLAVAEGSNRVTVTARFWFDTNVTDKAQGAAARFTTLLKAIQTGGPRP